jgi:hypothetical protein
MLCLREIIYIISTLFAQAKIWHTGGTSGKRPNILTKISQKAPKIDLNAKFKLLN